MNIFILDNHPIKAAQAQCNKHVVKMILESAQMLSTAHRILDGDLYIDASSGRKIKRWKLDKYNNELYNATHINHPCNAWLRESTANYKWLYDHFIALCDEYTYRYGKVHLSDTKLRNALSAYPKNLPEGDLTPFALAMKTMSPDSIVKSNPVESYRKYYITKKEKFNMVWTKRQEPCWFIT